MRVCQYANLPLFQVVVIRTLNQVLEEFATGKECLALFLPVFLKALRIGIAAECRIMPGFKMDTEKNRL